ncbi:MAG: hypothetical protein QFB86_03410 [Patescibacteria group bacterium]|nr:hypothetical protein [Patescibacteria group bacterium]
MIPKKTVIAVDIDDVLAASAEGFLEFSNKTYNTNLSIPEYSEHWAQMWQIDHDAVTLRVNDFYDSDTIARYVHKAGSQEVLTKLAEQYTIIAITARQRRSQDITNNWIHARYPGVFGDVQYAGIYDAPLVEEQMSMTKGSLFASNEVSYVIDDQLKHCLAAAELGIATILFGDYPWNQADELPKNIQRCADWQAVGDYFATRG